MPDNFDLDAALRGSAPKGDHFDLDAVLASGAELEAPKSAAYRFVHGVADALNPVTMAKGIGQAVFHPVDTASALYEAQLATGAKAAEAERAGHGSEAAGYRFASGIPVLGPMIAGIGEQAGSGDIAGAAGTAVGLAALPRVAANTPGVIKAAIKPIPMAGKWAAPHLRASAVKQYEQVLGATTKDNKALASQVVPSLVDRGVMAPTRPALLEKFKASAAAAGENLDEALAKVPEDLKVDLVKADAKLESLKSQHVIKTADGGMAPANDAAAAAIEEISKLQADLKNLDPSFGSARKFRQVLDRQVTAGNKAFGRTIREGSVLDVTREGANAIRAVLAEADPNIAALNKELSFWLKAKDVLSATVDRTASQARPLSQTILAGAGAAGELAAGGGLVSAGIKGKLLATVAKVTTSTGWRTASATLKGKLAKALMAGDEAAVNEVAATVAPAAARSAPEVAKPARVAPGAAKSAPGGVHAGYQALVDSVQGKTPAEALKILAEQDVSSFLVPGIFERAGIKAPEVVSDAVRSPHPGQASPPFVGSRLQYLRDQEAMRGKAPEAMRLRIESNKLLGGDLANVLNLPEVKKLTVREQGQALLEKAKRKKK